MSAKHTVEVVCGDGSIVLGHGMNYDLEAFEAYRYGTAARVSLARTAAGADAVRLELFRQLSRAQLAQKTAEADGLRRTALALRAENERLRELLTDIEAHMSRGAALHPGSLIFAEDAPAIDVIRAALETAVNSERERIIGILSRTEFTSLDHMPHEAATIIRSREVIP